MNKILSYLRKKDLYLFIARYLLAGEMIGYGLLKVVGVQAVFVFPFAGWQHPLEEATGSQLTWAFIGYTPWFTIIMGLFEFLPAILLLFRRTTLLGAILLFPMTLGVFLVNQALDLWLYTKWLTAGLLLLNCIIFLFEWQRIKSIAMIITSKMRPQKWPLPEIIINLLVVTVMVYAITYRSFYNKNERNALTGDWAHHHPYEWTLVAEKINDSILPHHLLRAYFQPKNVYSEINDSVNNGKGYINYDLDDKVRLLSFRFMRYRDNQFNYYSLHGKFKYNFIADTMLQLEKLNDDSTLSHHTWTFSRRIINKNRYN